MIGNARRDEYCDKYCGIVERQLRFNVYEEFIEV